MQKIKGWYSRRSDQWKATLRTAWASLMGSFILLVLTLFGSATDWLNGEKVDLVQEMSNFGRALGLLLITFFTSLMTFYMNRGTKGATYPPPAPPNA
jgi:polyferredoxin